MSGLFAVLNLNERPVDPAIAQKLLNRIGYRGTDAQNIWHQGDIAMGHTQFQLTSYDVHDRQPATRGQVTITADVLLLARAELVAALTAQRRAVTLETPDSELIIEAYLVWGDDCLSHILGEFTFILWDADKKKLLAAQDPLRVRELYYAVTEEAVIVSNEMGAVLLHPAVSATLNEAVIGDFLLFSTTSRHRKNETVFKDIQRLPIGHALHAQGQQHSTRPYWDFPYDEPMLRYDHPQAYVEHFYELFKQIVKERVEHIDRVVVHMSGGLDSTSIASMIVRLITEGEIQTKISLLSMGYETLIPDKEAPFARLAAQKMNLPLEFFNSDPFIPRPPLSARMEPYPDLTPNFTKSVNRQSASLGKLSFSGNGGDEVFTNTPLYEVLLRHPLPQAINLYFWLWRMMGERPHLGGASTYVRRLLTFGRETSTPSAFPFPDWLQPDFVNRLNLRERLHVPWNYSLKNSHPTQPEIPLYVRLGTWNMRSEFLEPHDFTPLNYSVPFIDLRLLRFALSLPPAPWNKRKLMLRQAMVNDLPPEVLRRPKTALGPVDIALTNLLGGEWLDQWEPVPELAQYVRREAIPPIFQSNSDERIGVGSRPLLLNEWLKALNEWLHNNKTQG